jgi:hypothetical protein
MNDTILGEVVSVVFWWFLIVWILALAAFVAFITYRSFKIGFDVGLRCALAVSVAFAACVALFLYGDQVFIWIVGTHMIAKLLAGIVLGALAAFLLRQLRWNDVSMAVYLFGLSVVVLLVATMLAKSPWLGSEVVWAPLGLFLGTAGYAILDPRFVVSRAILQPLEEIERGYGNANRKRRDMLTRGTRI